MRLRTERRIANALLVALATSIAYATFYVGALLIESAKREEGFSILEHVTATVPGKVFLASAAVAGAILAWWKINSFRRRFRRDTGAPHRDEVVTKLRDALDEKE